jgi:Tol biopolymer transport system component
MIRVIIFSLCIFILIAGNTSAQANKNGKIIFWSEDRNWNDPNKPLIIRSVYIMNADGSDVTKLIEQNNRGNDRNFEVGDIFSLSPDCSKAVFRIIITSKNFDFISSDIATMDLNTGKITNLTNGEQEICLLPRWSPDGSKIVFTVIALSGKRYLYTMNSNGSDIRKLTDGAEADWCFDGQKIAFIRDGINIYTIEADGNNESKIAEVNLLGNLRRLRCSPNNNKIIFLTETGNVYIIDSDGKNQKKIIEQQGINCCWSPDGSGIAFVNVIDNKECDLWLMELDDGKTERLTNNDRCENEFDWRFQSFIAINSLLDNKTTCWGKIKVGN